MQVGEVIHAKGSTVETVAPGSGLQAAANRMASLGYGSLVVTDTDGRLVGVLEERDLVRAVAKHGDGVARLRVRDVLSHGRPTCGPGETLTAVMHRMTATRFRHLPVVEADGRVVGLISIGDVVKHRLEELELETHVLRDAYVARR